MIREDESNNQFESPQASVEILTQNENFSQKFTELMNEISQNQDLFQKRIEDSICHGLESITQIKYGSQAKKYLEETRRERDQLSTVISEHIRSAINEVC